jgi:hypothetical protein
MCPACAATLTLIAAGAGSAGGVAALLVKKLRGKGRVRRLTVRHAMPAPQDKEPPHER